MLVLTRKLGENIVIGNDITLTVVDIERGKIRLGIVAPKSVPVYRGEIQAEIDKDRAEAAAAARVAQEGEHEQS